MPPELSEMEKRILQEGEQVYLASLQPGYKLIRDAMRLWENEALKDLEDCLSTDKTVVTNLTARWQERRRFTKMIDTYVQDVVESRKTVLREIAESSGMTPLQAAEAADNL